jgi:hypothetical protein
MIEGDEISKSAADIDGNGIGHQNSGLWFPVTSFIPAQLETRNAKLETYFDWMRRG